MISPSGGRLGSVEYSAHPVCVVAHEAIDRHLLSSFCETIHHPAIAALASVEELIGRLNAGDCLPPSVILLDQPFQRPMLAVSEIRALPRFADTLIIVIDASDNVEWIDECLRAGALDYLVKPMRLGEFGLRLHSALRLADEIARRKKNEFELSLSLKRIEKDLEAATRLQFGLLPPIGRHGHVEIAWGFRPCDALGGDLLNVIVMDDVVYWYLFDVAGHGIPAALFAVGLHRLMSDGPGSLLRDPTGDPRDPAEVLNDLNERFPLDLDSLIYFTIAFGCHDRRSGTLRYANAGHPSMMVRVEAKTPRELQGGGPPIGMTAGRPFASSVCHLPKGGRLMLFSDGLLEAVHAKSGEAYGLPRLARCLDDGGGTLPELVVTVMDDVVAWRADEPVEDDLSLLVVEVPPCS